MGDSLPTTRYEENARSQLLEFIRMQQLNVAEKKRPREEVKPEATITKKAQKTSTSEKRRVEKACAHCQRSHLSCDNARPCKRCVDRRIAHLCFDPPAKPKGRKPKDAKEYEELLKQQLSQSQASCANQSQISPLAFSSPAPSPEYSNAKLPIISLLNFPRNTYVPSSPPYLNRVECLDKTPSSSSSRMNISFSPFTSEVASPISDDTLSLSDLLFAPIDQMETLLDNVNSDSLPIQPSPTINSNTSTNQHFETPSFIAHKPEFLERYLNYLRKRVPEIVDDVKSMIAVVKPRFMALMHSLTRESILSMQKVFENELAFASQVFEKIPVPTIMWEKSNTIHYCNKSFRTLTGFEDPVPTPGERFPLFNMLSPASLKRYIQVVMPLLHDGSTEFALVPLEWLCFGKYLSMLCWISIKRAPSTGLSLVVTAYLTPTVYNPVLDVQLQNVAKRPLEGSLLSPLPTITELQSACTREQLPES